MAIGRMQSRPVTPFTIDVDTLTGIIATVDNIVHGGDHTEGTYLAVALGGGSGTGAEATVVVNVDGDVTSVTITDGGTGYADTDTGLTISNATIGGAGNATVDVLAVVGEVATVTVSDGGTGWLTGDVVSVDELDTDGAGSGLAGTVTATAGAVTAFTVTAGGTGYAVADAQSYIGEGEIGVTSTDYVDHDEYELGGIVSEYTDATQSTYKPEIPPNVLGTDQVLVKTVLKPDMPQWKIQQRKIDGGAVTVYAEPTLVDSNGVVVGNTVRAEDCVDQARCEALGFVWETASTGDADAADYGYCREIVPADVDGVATAQSDCPAGYKFVVDDCNTAWTATEVNNGTAAAAIGSSFDARSECIASGNHWESSKATNKCIDAGTPDNFSLANFNYATSSTPKDYAKTTCLQFGYEWIDATQTCVSGAFSSSDNKATCEGKGHGWIAGVCYNINTFGDGHSRMVMASDDPTALPK